MAVVELAAGRLLGYVGETGDATGDASGDAVEVFR